MNVTRYFLLLCYLACATAVGAQRTPSFDYTGRDPLAGYANHDSWLTPADTFHPGRFYTAAGTGAILYSAATYGLYDIWYKEYATVGLRSFDDWGEWNQMDKAGHFYSAYMYSRHAFAGLRWAGLKRPVARYTALGVANLLQGTIEVFDGYSEEWGFSWTDMGANLAGSLVFTLQDIAWKEQRILVKVSNDFRPHPDIPVSRGEHTSNVGYVSRLRFGDYPFERTIKDYNAMTFWLSVNPASFFPKSPLPDWLNIAVGYGSENVYGAYFNSWRDAAGNGFNYGPERYRQWALSPDIYFSRIPTRKRWVRLVLGILDSIKRPAPALEYSKGKFSG
ncbi:MAG: DUF2279 domain-containing protein, partial [Lewinella sp.]